MTRLFECEDFANAIPSHQFGFRKQHGTTQQLARVSQFILKSFEERKFCSAVFIDVSEAFDRVWHAGLLCKLVKLLPLPLFNVLRSYLEDRTFVVKCNDGTTSRIGNIGAGVPQGSVLGPILYTIFSSDMPLPPSQLISSSNSCEQMLSTYADDTIIMTSSLLPHECLRNNQSYLDNLMAWAERWCVTINVAKTAHVLFSLRNSGTNNNHSLLLNGQPIINKNRQPYLGIHLDRKLILNHHVSYLCGRLLATGEKFKWLLSKKSLLSKECKAIIYKQLMAPIWSYGLPVWGALVSDTQFNRIQTAQNKILRKIFNAPWFVRNQTLRDRYNISSAEDMFNQMSSKFAASLCDHPNVEARKLIHIPFEPHRLKRLRYSRQLQKHVLPLRRILPQSQGQLSAQLPTLLRLEKEAQDRNESLRKRANELMQIVKARIDGPPQRSNELAINWLRHRILDGRTSRRRAIELLDGQPISIQRCVISDLQPHELISLESLESDIRLICPLISDANLRLEISLALERLLDLNLHDLLHECYRRPLPHSHPPPQSLQSDSIAHPQHQMHPVLQSVHHPSESNTPELPNLNLDIPLGPYRPHQSRIPHSLQWFCNWWQRTREQQLQHLEVPSEAGQLSPDLQGQRSPPLGPLVQLVLNIDSPSSPLRHQEELQQQQHSSQHMTTLAPVLNQLSSGPAVNDPILSLDTSGQHLHCPSSAAEQHASNELNFSRLESELHDLLDEP